MMQQIVCARLVGRDEELSRLEDALLASNRGESRFVALSGEAGIGKTRLATDLTSSAEKIGCTVMWGGCSEAELSLPYLPFLEAVGNFLGEEGIEDLGARLGGARRELAQLFPQLGTEANTLPPGDPTQARLRLFESIVALLTIPAQRSGVLLVVEDIHWADSSTRELLDYLARRVRSMRIMVLVTYRRDELHRKHPLLPIVQGWRRSGLADVIELDELSSNEVGEMIASIFDVAEPQDDLRDLMYQRSEGNPFVLEEMLKEAIDCGDIYRTTGGWERSSAELIRLPDTVRDTILLRLQRLPPSDVEVLEIAAVLGRQFEYQTLVATSGLDESVIQDALVAATREQLLEEIRTELGGYRFRHALTQEAIYTETVLPRRQQIHSRAADVLQSRGGEPAFDLAFHLLGAARYQEAVPVCLRGAEQAVKSLAFGEAVALYERALLHVSEPRQRGEITCKLGEALWHDGRSDHAERTLNEGIEILRSLGEIKATAHFLITRGRCRWEISQPQLALVDYETARDILEPDGASYDLAVAYMRIAGLHSFELDGQPAVEAAEKAVAIASEAGSEEARAWALGFLALGRFDVGDGDEAFGILREGYELAAERGVLWIASNHAWNDVWMRVHAMVPGMDEALTRLEAVQHGSSAGTGSMLLARSYVSEARGRLSQAADEALESAAVSGRLGYGKQSWRAELVAGEALLEMGQLDRAERVLPDVSTRAELQDVVYDSRLRIRLARAKGDAGSAVEHAMTIVEGAQRFSLYPFALALAAEPLVPAGRIEVCKELLRLGRAAPSPYGGAFLDQLEARIALAEGDTRRAEMLLRSALADFTKADFALDELRTQILLSEALARLGEAKEAADQMNGVVARAASLQAAIVVAEARAVASSLGIELEDEVGSFSAGGVAPVPTVAGERLVTVMFADVRGYTEMTSRLPPAEMADRIATLQRWAKQEIERHHGLVDKFAGDAVMATFNASGDSIDHCLHAIQAALALRDKAALLDLRLGIGIAVGPAIVGALAPGANVSVIGNTTNLAARLQSQAAAGEFLLTEPAFKRVEPWISEHCLDVTSDRLTLKGFDEPVVAYRLRSAQIR